MWIGALCLWMALGAYTAATGEARPKPAPALDPAYLTDPLWQDGNAEIAFYEMRFEDRDAPPVLAGSILAAHRFDPRTFRKVDSDEEAGEAAWKWIFLYEHDAPVANRLRRAFYLDARQRDLELWRFIATESSWDGHCAYSIRVDRASDRFHARASSCRTLLPLPTVHAGTESAQGTFAIGQMPLLIRASSFVDGNRSTLAVTISGTPVTAHIERIGIETVDLVSGPVRAEKITVTYESDTGLPAETAPPTIFGHPAKRETYWRSTAAHRQIVKVESDRYTMRLIEEIRGKHWQDDLFPRLDHVDRYP